MDRLEELERESNRLSWTLRGLLAALILIAGLAGFVVLSSVVPTIRDMLTDLLDGQGQLPALTKLFLQVSRPLSLMVGLTVIASILPLFAVARPAVWPVVLGSFVLVGLVLLTALAIVACFVPLLSLIGEMSAS